MGYRDEIALILALSPSVVQNWTVTFSLDSQLITQRCGSPAASLVIWKIQIGERILSLVGFAAWTRAGARRGIERHIANLAAEVRAIPFSRRSRASIDWMMNAKTYVSTEMNCGVKVCDLEQKAQVASRIFEAAYCKSVRRGRPTLSPIWRNQKQQMLHFGVQIRRRGSESRDCQDLILIRNCLTDQRSLVS